MKYNYLMRIFEIVKDVVIFYFIFGKRIKGYKFCEKLFGNMFWSLKFLILVVKLLGCYYGNKWCEMIYV